MYKGEDIMNTKNIIYLLSCLVLAVVGEMTLFKGRIGLSLSIIVVCFYAIYFFYTRKRINTHKRLGIFLFICIWILTLCYIFVANPIFYGINLFIIILLIFIHTNLITSPVYVDWCSWTFIRYLGKKVTIFFNIGNKILQLLKKTLKVNVKAGTYSKTKKVILGMIIVTPILGILLTLLSVSDEKFSLFIEQILLSVININMEQIGMVIRILMLFILFVCGIKTISKPTIIIPSALKIKATWDNTILATILFSINILYLLFTIVQFRYFFSDVLTQGHTYSEYARRGFFELMLVTIINISIIVLVHTFAEKKSKWLKTLLSCLILFSFIILLSSHLRLSLYEEAYGYTYLRLFSHSILFFLAGIFLFTLVKIWLDKLNLARYMVLSFLVYYCVLNAINLDQIIVKNNLERYEYTNKLDVQYLNSLSFSSVPLLVEFYKEDKSIVGLKEVLLDKQYKLEREENSWQGYNIIKHQAEKALLELNLQEGITETEKAKERYSL